MLDFSKQQDIGILRIDNPSRANILNREALMRFKELLSQLEAQVEVAEPLAEMPKSIWSKKDTIGLQLKMRPK